MHTDDLIDDVTTKESFKSNALIVNVDKELRYERLECVAELDFANMYASIIIAFNISPETVIKKGQERSGYKYIYITVDDIEIGIQQ